MGHTCHCHRLVSPPSGSHTAADVKGRAPRPVGDFDLFWVLGTVTENNCAKKNLGEQIAQLTVHPNLDLLGGTKEKAEGQTPFHIESNLSAAPERPCGRFRGIWRPWQLGLPKVAAAASSSSFQFPVASTPLLSSETQALPLPLCGPCDLSTPTRLQPPHKRRHLQLVPSARFLLECSHHHRKKLEHAVERAPSGTSGTSGMAERTVSW